MGVEACVRRGIGRKYRNVQGKGVKLPHFRAYVLYGRSVMLNFAAGSGEQNNNTLISVDVVNTAVNSKSLKINQHKIHRYT